MRMTIAENNGVSLITLFLFDIKYWVQRLCSVLTKDLLVSEAKAKPVALISLICGTI